MSTSSRARPSDQALAVPVEPVSRLAPSGFDPSREEGRCDDCGGVNPVWFAPNELWNFVIGGPEAKGDPGGFICPSCFIVRAEYAGVYPTAWELRPERGRRSRDAQPQPGDTPCQMK